MDQVLDAGVRVVILRLRRTHLAASTAISALEHLTSRAKGLGILLLISGVSPDLRSRLMATGIGALIEEPCLFGASEVLFESTRQALAYAQDCLKPPGEHPA
jgi:anti-anti-sigma regulatory factor